MSTTNDHADDERTVLTHSLARHRQVVLWKTDGLTDEQLRRSVVASGTNLLGLVKHLAGMEYGWFCEPFGYEVEAVPYADGGDSDPQADLHPQSHESVDEIVAYYRRACAAADQVVAQTALDTLGTSWSGEKVSMRWVLVHMIEETVRHAGHMDIVREFIDGTTGDHPR